MANTAGWTTSFKRELMCGIHAIGTTVARAGTGADILKAALYYATAALSPATAAYTTTGECAGGGYVAGGVTVTNGNEPAVAGTTAYWTPSDSIAFASITQNNVDAILMYNNSQGDKSVGVFKFTPQNVVAGTLTLTMPANTSAAALLRIN